MDDQRLILALGFYQPNPKNSSSLDDVVTNHLQLVYQDDFYEEL